MVSCPHAQKTSAAPNSFKGRAPVLHGPQHVLVTNAPPKKTRLPFVMIKYEGCLKQLITSQVLNNERP